MTLCTHQTEFLASQVGTLFSGRYFVLEFEGNFLQSLLDHFWGFFGCHAHDAVDFLLYVVSVFQRKPEPFF
jgi:hypothetical protein